MMRKITMMLIVSVTVCFLSGCRHGGEEYKIKIKNLTGVEISELYIAPETSTSEMRNYLTENLSVDGVIELSLGNLTEEDVSQGFAMEVYNAEDGTSNDFGMLMIGNGGTVTLYLDVWGLAAAVDMTDEEVKEEIIRASEDADSVTTDE